MRFLIRLLINAAALYVAVRLVPGVTYGGSWLQLLGVALVFGVLNAILRPILLFFSFPFLLVTLGLFTFIINAVMLWLTSSLSSALGLAFNVSGFWAAFWGALVVTVVSFILSVVLAEEKKED